MHGPSSLDEVATSSLLQNLIPSPSNAGGGGGAAHMLAVAAAAGLRHGRPLGSSGGGGQSVSTGTGETGPRADLLEAKRAADAAKEAEKAAARKRHSGRMTQVDA